MPYGDRIIPLNVGVWYKDTGLKVIRNSFGDGREWATQVCEVESQQDADVKAVSISTLMKDYFIDKIDLLKIDIEGSEVKLFNKEFDEWLPDHQPAIAH